MPTAPVLKAHLTLKDRPVKSYTFLKETITIGRDPDSDIHLDNMGVSRRHARIEYTDGAFYLVDLGSSNGTFLEERRIERERLIDRARVQIGKFVLEIGLESTAAPQTPANLPMGAEEDGTMILTTDQLARVLAPSPPPQPVLQVVEGSCRPRPHARRFPWIWVVVAAVAVTAALLAGLLFF